MSGAIVLTVVVGRGGRLKLMLHRPSIMKGGGWQDAQVGYLESWSEFLAFARQASWIAERVKSWHVVDDGTVLVVPWGGQRLEG